MVDSDMVIERWYQKKQIIESGNKSEMNFCDVCLNEEESHSIFMNTNKYGKQTGPELSQAQYKLSWASRLILVERWWLSGAK